MKRALIALALLWPISARATEFWQDQVNTAGNVSVVSPPGGSCFLYQTAAFDVQCYTTVPASFIDTVPTGVLEGVAGAITGYTAISTEVQTGAVSGGGLRQFTSLTFDGTHLGLGTPSSGIQTALSGAVSSSLSQLTLAPTGGTAVGNIFNLIPKGAGSFGITSAVFLYNSDAIADATNYERLLIEGHGSLGYLILSGAAGTGSPRPIALDATGSTTTQLALSASGSTSFGVGDILMSKAAAQDITKTGGTGAIGTGDANVFNIKTNGVTRIGIGTTGGITMPAFTGGGNQCAFFTNAGLLSVTGSACGTGSGAGGITQLTGDGTAGPGSGSQAFTLVNLPNDVSQAGDLLATSIVAPATPSAGKARLYVDSTSKNLAVINDAGTVNHGVQTVACAASNWVSASTNAGGLTCTQPAFTDLTGSEACAQTPAFTGDVTKASGACTTVVKNLPNGTTQAGIIVATGHAPPGLPPPGGLGDCWYDSTNLVWQCETSLGGISYTDFNYTCGTHSFASSSTVGTTACTQPAFADLSGVATCAQTPAFTGDTTKASGSCTTVTSALTDGGGVSHSTTTTWPTLSILQTTGFGNIAASGVACSHLPAFTGDVTKPSGSCAATVASVPCSALPAAGTCGPTSTSGATGTYLTSITTDAKGRVSAVGTTTVPVSTSIVYTLASNVSMGYNQSTLVMPLPSGAPIINTAAAGTAIDLVLAANWGSSSQSPPTYPLVSLGSVRCTGDISFYSISGPGSLTMVTALYYVTTNPTTSSNWHLIASGTTSLAGGGSNFFNGIGFTANSGSGLIPANSSILLVLYRSDIGSLATLTTLNAQIVCSLGI